MSILEIKRISCFGKFAHICVVFTVKNLDEAKKAFALYKSGFLGYNNSRLKENIMLFDWINNKK